MLLLEIVVICDIVRPIPIKNPVHIAIIVDTLDLRKIPDLENSSRFRLYGAGVKILGSARLIYSRVEFKFVDPILRILVARLNDNRLIVYHDLHPLTRGAT